MHRILDVLKSKDEHQYITVGKMVLSLNKGLAMAGLALAGTTAVATAFIGSSEASARRLWWKGTAAAADVDKGGGTGACEDSGMDEDEDGGAWQMWAGTAGWTRMRTTVAVRRMRARTTRWTLATMAEGIRATRRGWWPRLGGCGRGRRRRPGWMRTTVAAVVAAVDEVRGRGGRGGRGPLPRRTEVTEMAAVADEGGDDDRRGDGDAGHGGRGGGPVERDDDSGERGRSGWRVGDADALVINKCIAEDSKKTGTGTRGLHGLDVNGKERGRQ
uniref:Uncharacterized protein n=1 Tax=Oryza meridionalis TaxID=40149 RepID=A0A0E0D3M0_9ORYZ